MTRHRSPRASGAHRGRRATTGTGEHARAPTDPAQPRGRPARDVEPAFDVDDRVHWAALGAIGGLVAVAAVAALVWLPEPRRAADPIPPLPLDDGEFAVCPIDDNLDPTRPPTPPYRRAAAARFGEDIDSVIVPDGDGGAWPLTVEREERAVTRPGDRVNVLEELPTDKVGVEMEVGAAPAFRLVLEPWN